MKKVFSIALSLVLIIFSLLTVCAVSKTYIIDELDISVNPPERYYSLTKDTAPDAPELAQFGYTKTELLQMFEEEEMYYIAYSDMYYDEIALYASEADVESMDVFSEEEFDSMLKDLATGIEEEGLNVSDYREYESHNSKYMVIYYSDSNNDYAVKYVTIADHMLIDVVCWTYGSEPTTNQKQHYLSFIDSITFNVKGHNPTPSGTYDTKPEEASDAIIDYEEIEFTDSDKATIKSAVIVIIVTLVINILAAILIPVIIITNVKKRRKAAQMMLNAQAEAEKKFCIYCGTELHANDAFCHNCGKNQNINSQ